MRFAAPNGPSFESHVEAGLTLAGISHARSLKRDGIVRSGIGRNDLHSVPLSLLKLWTHSCPNPLHNHNNNNHSFLLENKIIWQSANSEFCQKRPIIIMLSAMRRHFNEDLKGFMAVLCAKSPRKPQGMKYPPQNSTPIPFWRDPQPLKTLKFLTYLKKSRNFDQKKSNFFLGFWVRLISIFPSVLGGVYITLDVPGEEHVYERWVVGMGYLYLILYIHPGFPILTLSLFWLILAISKLKKLMGGRLNLRSWRGGILITFTHFYICLFIQFKKVEKLTLKIANKCLFSLTVQTVLFVVHFIQENW